MTDRDGGPLHTPERRAERRRKSDPALPLSVEILDQMPDGILLADLHGRIVRWSARSQAIFGYPAEEALGRVLAFMHSAENPAREAAALVAETLSAGQIFKELACRRRDGTEVPIEATFKVLPGEVGQPRFLLGILRDTSEKGRQRKFTDGLIQSSVDGILAFDRDLRCTVWNPAMEKMLGYPSSRVLGQRASEVFPFLVETGEIRFFEAALAGKSLSAIDRPYVSSSGEKGFFDGHYAPLYDDRGKIAGGLGIIRETSHRKQLEERLRESHRLESLGTLAGGIAHDFNNILNIISAYGALIMKNAGTGSEAGSHVEAIQQTVERGAGVVRQLLTVARRADVVFEPVDVNAVVAELTRLLRETFPRTIEIETHLGVDLEPVDADPNQVLQALLNLSLNARDAMPDGGRLRIATAPCLRDSLTADRARACVSVCVSDTGTGIDAETRERLFEPFFTTKERGSGTGLGLAVVYGIAEGHGGHVEVDSAPGSGSTFRVCLPVSSAPSLLQERPVVSHFERADGAGRTVLLVEDEPLLLESVRQLLESEGYAVKTAADGVSAVERFRQGSHEIDLVLSDVGLPKLDGWEAFQRMKEIDPDVAAILVSGLLSADVRARYAAAGVKRSLRKPYTAHEMLRVVGEVVSELPRRATARES